MTEHPPFRGAIRYCNPERDAGKDLHLVTDFEIWNGERWVHATEAAEMEFNIELTAGNKGGAQ